MGKFVGTIERKTNGWKAGVNVSSDILVWVGESVGYKGVSCWFRVLRPIARVYTLRPFTTINHRANRGELRTTVIQPFNRFSLGWISLWASRAIPCFLTFAEKGEPKISMYRQYIGEIQFSSVKGDAIIMFIGLKNDRVAGCFLFPLSFFFIVRILSTSIHSRNWTIDGNEIFWNTRIVQGLSIDREEKARGNYAIIIKDLKISGLLTGIRRFFSHQVSSKARVAQPKTSVRYNFSCLKNFTVMEMDDNFFLSLLFFLPLFSFVLEKFTFARVLKALRETRREIRYTRAYLLKTEKRSLYLPLWSS